MWALSSNTQKLFMATQLYALLTEIEALDAKRIGLRISLELERLNTNYWKEMGEILLILV